MCVIDRDFPSVGDSHCLSLRLLNKFSPISLPLTHCSIRFWERPRLSTIWGFVPVHNASPRPLAESVVMRVWLISSDLRVPATSFDPPYGDKFDIVKTSPSSTQPAQHTSHPRECRRSYHPSLVSSCWNTIRIDFEVTIRCHWLQATLSIPTFIFLEENLLLQSFCIIREAFKL